MRKINGLLLVIYGVLHTLVGIAQGGQKIDSLLTVLKNPKDDTSKVNSLNELSRQLLMIRKVAEAKKYAEDALVLAEKKDFKKGIATAYHFIATGYSIQSNYPEALKSWTTALKIFEEIGDKSGIACSYSNIGLSYKNQGHYPEALKNYLVSIKINQEIKEKRDVGIAYNNIGTIYGTLGNYPEALKNCLASLKIREEIGDKRGIGASYVNIGVIYQTQGNYSESLKNYLAAVKLFEEIGDKYGIAICYGNIGIIYGYQGNYTEALKNHIAALKISEEIEDKEGIADSNGNIGGVYNTQGNYPEALKRYLLTLKLFQGTGNREGIAVTYKNIGQTYTYLKDFVNAKRYLNDALSLSRELGLIENIKASYEIKARLDSASGNWQEAFHNHKLYIVYRDSMVNKENTDKITKVQMQYDFDKIEDSLKYQQALTDEKLEAQTLLAQQQKRQKTYLIAGFVLFVVLSFFIYRNYRTRQQLKLQMLRNKIAIDLHDDVGSTLSSISIFSQMAQQQSKETIPLLEAIGDSSRKMLDAMADIVWTINPQNDLFDKIILRMRSFAYELLGAKKIDFRFAADGDMADIKLSMEAKRNLYLIFKEATNNMAKYAQASKAMFSIKREKDKMVMLITDNGKGFDNNKPSQGNGLKNMQKRATQMGAVLLIDSKPGNGTTIRLELAV